MSLKMYGPLKILHRSHTGRLRSHEHTSYLILAFLLAVTGLVLAIYTFSANAATPYNGPEAGSIGLTGRVPAVPPKTGATITSPTNGQHFTTLPVTVKGNCPANTLVEIYKNNIFAGSTPCDDSGHFSIEIDLLFGQNSLTAQVFDVLNQAGPVSPSVTVFYDYTLAGAAPSSILDLGAQLLLDTDAVFRGSFPNQQMNVPITVIGGTAPFAINIFWGDGKNQLMPAASDTTFNASHAYAKPGTYKITIQGTDSKGLSAFLTVAAIINGQPSATPATAAAVPNKKILMLWPIFAIAATALISFWIGEKREKKLLKAKEQPEIVPFSTPPPASQPPAGSSTTS
jgi:hypothetical protein